MRGAAVAHDPSARRYLDQPAARSAFRPPRVLPGCQLPPLWFNRRRSGAGPYRDAAPTFRQGPGREIRRAHEPFARPRPERFRERSASPHAVQPTAVPLRRTSRRRVPDECHRPGVLPARGRRVVDIAGRGDRCPDPLVDHGGDFEDPLASPGSGSSHVSPTRTLAAGFALVPFSRTCPPRHASDASVRDLKSAPPRASGRVLVDSMRASLHGRRSDGRPGERSSGSPTPEAVARTRLPRPTPVGRRAWEGDATTSTWRHRQIRGGGAFAVLS